MLMYSPLIVPDAVERLAAVPFGPYSVYLSWDSLNEMQLRANVSSQRFQLFIDNSDTVFKTESSNVTTIMSSDQLRPNSSHSVTVRTDNGVFRSSDFSLASFVTWPLPPTPSITNRSNTSLVVELSLDDIHNNAFRTFRICLNVNGPSL